MCAAPAELSERDQRLGEAILAYRQAVESGQPFARRDWVARYPELTGELEEFLADEDRVQLLATSLRPEEKAPVEVGGYDVLEVLGRGGMGIVYKARQRSLNRFVALKIIRAGLWAGPTDADLLRAEAEAVASLDHPQIVTIHEVGDYDGRPYFSMKLIEGGSLAQRGVWGEGSGTREVQQWVARIVASVARAVHHAHQRGILHRDLKPSNILLDRQGVPHVSDFGLAKRLETAGDRAVQGGSTLSGQVVGTPNYMAPEQAEGKRGAVTTATDVYGLGGILYTLLTGKAPFAGDTLLDTLRQVKECEPEPPRRSNPPVDRDLETICLKCLQKEPRRRQGSAEELAADLERWLAGVPIMARPVRPWERAWLWCRRNRARAGFAITGAALAFALLVGLPIGLYLLWQREQEAAHAWEQEAHQRQRAQENGAVAQRQQQIADEEQQRAELARKDMDATFYVLRRVTTRYLAHEPGLTRLRRLIIREELQAFQDVHRARGDNPAIRQETGRQYLRLGQLSFELGDLEEAADAFRLALDLQEKLLAVFPDHPGYQQDLAGTLSNLSTLEHQRGQPARAEATCRRAIDILERLAAERPAERVDRRELAVTLHNLATLLAETNRLQEAEQADRRVVTLNQALVGEAPDNLQYQDDLAKAEYNLGVTLDQAGRRVDAVTLCRQALARHAELSTHHPSVPDYRSELAHDHVTLAKLLKSSQPREADASYEQAVVLLKTLVADFPEKPAYQQQLAHVYNGLALWRHASWQDAEAERLHGEALELRQRLVTDFPSVPDYQSELGATLNNVALLHLDRREWTAARALLQDAVRHQRTALEANPRNGDFRLFMRNHCWSLARACVALGEHREAAAAAEELPRLFPAGWQEYERAARFVAQCIPLVGEDSSVAEEERAPLTLAYADRSMTLLQQAVQKGFKDATALQKAPEFAPLRGREDFRELLRELQERKPAGPGRR